MTRKLLAIALGAALLAGCQMAEINQAPIAFTATKKLNNKGVTTFEVRTFVKKKNEPRKEIIGATCKLEAPGFRSSFTTPALVTAPDMGPLTPAAAITCGYDGATKTVPISAMNLTTAEIDSRAMSVAAGAGILGAVVGSIAAANQKASRDATLDVYGYPPVTVEFSVE